MLELPVAVLPDFGGGLGCAGVAVDRWLAG